MEGGCEAGCWQDRTASKPGCVWGVTPGLRVSATWQLSSSLPFPERQPGFQVCVL